MSSSMDRTQLDEQICKQALNFIKLFYDVMDRKREKTIHMYTDSEPTVVWNGNPYQGADDIGRFLANLPQTRHEIVSLDAQRIPGAACGGQVLLVLMAAGSVTVQENIHAFSENFTLVMDDMTLKVKSQRFRYID